MKAIRIPCPHCRKLLGVEMEVETVKCSYCGKAYKVKVEIILELVKNEKIL